MSLHCPFCESINIMLVESTVQNSNSTLSSLASPAALAALGTTVAKSFNLPPVMGGIAGTLLGEVFSAFTAQSIQPQHNLYFCHHCYQKFLSSPLY